MRCKSKLSVEPLKSKTESSFKTLAFESQGGLMFLRYVSELNLEYLRCELSFLVYQSESTLKSSGVLVCIESLVSEVQVHVSIL